MIIRSLDEIGPRGVVAYGLPDFGGFDFVDEFRNEFASVDVGKSHTYRDVENHVASVGRVIGIESSTC